jgi:anti-sigma factor RsiW
MERNAQHAFDAEEVMAYLDGELEARRAAALAAHLVSCSECQEVAQGFRALSERMLNFEVEHPSAGMNETVLAALNSGKTANAPAVGRAQEQRAWNWRRMFARPRNWAIACAVTVAAIALIAIPILRREQSIPLNGRSIPDFMALESGTAKSRPPSAISNGYKKWLNDDVGYLQQNRDGQSPATALPASRGSNAVFSEPAPPPPPPSAGDELKAPENVGPMIVQTASLNILAANYDEASAAIEKLAAAHGGYVEKLDAKAQTGNARELSAALRIPTKQLDAFLADVRKLGHVEEETRSNEEVSDQYVDLQARLKSARATEQRLIELLGTRTGKLEDVLEAERELARIRGEIEGMQAQSAILVHRVNYATVQVDLSEEYRQVLGSGPISTGTKVRNAAVEGFTNLEEGAVALVVFVFAVGPSLLFWLAILLVPGWFAWKRFRVRGQR